MNDSPPARRRKKDEAPRGKRVTVRFSTSEYQVVKAGAVASNISVAAYVALRAQEPIRQAQGRDGVSEVQLRATVAEMYALKRILRGATTNLNQLARVANATQEDQPEAVHHARLISERMARLDSVIEMFERWAPS
jgi:hypothetical protein